MNAPLSTLNSSPISLDSGYLANSLAQLLEVTRREFERDREAAKASLATASSILQAEIERCSGANGSTRGGLAAWQILRVELTLTAIYTAPFTSGISVRSRVEARRTSLENSSWLSASRHMPMWWEGAWREPAT
jgi:hypothetical protein